MTQGEERDEITTNVKPPTVLSGGKRTNISKSAWLDDWWVGYGKDESCQFEGPWSHMVRLAAQILSHPATEVVAPNLYRPDLVESMTTEQRNNYDGGPRVTWPGEGRS